MLGKGRENLLLLVNDSGLDTTRRRKLIQIDCRRRWTRGDEDSQADINRGLGDAEGRDATGAGNWGANDAGGLHAGNVGVGT